MRARFEMRDIFARMPADELFIHAIAAAIAALTLRRAAAKRASYRSIISMSILKQQGISARR